MLARLHGSHPARLRLLTVGRSQTPGTRHVFHPPGPFRLASLDRSQTPGAHRCITQLTTHLDESNDLAASQWLDVQSEAYRAEGRALLRDFLRECSYFPEEYGRAELHRSVMIRFRRHQTLSPRQILQKSHIRYRHQGRKSLYALQRANDGSTRDLKRYLLLLYGRIGPRKHQLLQPLLPVQQAESELVAPSIQEADVEQLAYQSSTKLSESDATQSWSQHIPELTPQLKALVITQNRKRFVNMYAFRPKRPGKLDPKLPQLNTWFKPLPASRIKNMTKKWYAKLLDNILAPLPLEEWLRVFDIASGAKKLHQPPRRTSRRVPVRSALDLIGLKAKINDSDMMTRREAPISPKSLERAWADLFGLCSVMTWDQDQQRWRVYWGDEALANHTIADRLREEFSQTNSVGS